MTKGQTEAITFVGFGALVIAALLAFAPVNARDRFERNVSCGSVMSPDDSHWMTECEAERNSRKTLALIIGGVGGVAVYWGYNQEDEDG